MSNKSDRCERCAREYYYDGHERWCVAIAELQERVETIERLLIHNEGDVEAGPEE